MTDLIFWLRPKKNNQIAFKQARNSKAVTIPETPWPMTLKWVTHK